ncbi:CHC2 zinc finger domain-containing protein [Herbaspirillum seropedicae]|uniref:CHC2 zinc finger domain-containing protein n=1 Tax=Herbaspirillum seropedicae TaxID=964 RepID=UPI003FCD1B1E
MERYDLSEILTKISLEEVVKRLGIETERRGSQTRALCPFHQDTRPSLNLYSADGTSPAHFHCFACGAHGNAIELVKQVAGLEFLPAVNWLAQQFSLKPLRDHSTQQGHSKAARVNALDFALRTFDEQHDSQRFRIWCAERAIDEDFLHRQGVRCITHGVLVESLQRKNLGERVELIEGLESLGLLKRLRSQSSPKQGKLDLLDQFRDCFHDGRIIIPIGSADTNHSNVVGFAGRLLQNSPPDGVAKYLLTSGFDKGNHLFNAFNAFEAVRQLLKNGQTATLYLVEGFLDALRLQSLGQSAVALMGISLSNGQLELLKKLAESSTGPNELVFSVFLDSDPAGFGGANRLVRRLLDLPGIDLRWVGLPWRTVPALGKDPDTCLRDLSVPAQVAAWLQRFELPAEGVLLAGELGSQDASELQVPRWNQLAVTVRERALFRTALAAKRLYGQRLTEITIARLQDVPLPWAQQLQTMLAGNGSLKSSIDRDLYLDEELPRAALARRLAYHGSRRGELPCDEGAWQILNSNEYLFDQTALDRLRAAIQGDNWYQAAPFDAVHLPRKLTAEKEILTDPRRKVMPHPADLHAQQLFLNELLTQRHDRLSASGQAFSACIPAVRWYGSRQEVVVSGTYDALNEPDLEWEEPKTLSFGYQIDMDVLEGDKTPSDQGMFRPFGQCWRDFMGSLAHQCHAIGPRVHVLRLDAKRYYDSIQRYVVREELQKPLSAALRAHNPEGFSKMFGLAVDSPELDGALERLLTGLIFGHEYYDPEISGRTLRSEEVTGIPQGPVLSAYIGTIALFSVDDAARRFIRRTRAEKADADGKRRPRAGYARYVDDVVLFADSEELLKELRELLQAKAAERSIALIHKGENIRSGSPSQVMRQLNDGRGLAVSVPAWTAPIVGDGESDWSLGDELPKVDRQCALQMLRHPALMDQPEEVVAQVRAAVTAPDLRASDLGLCARWLWWHVASIRRPTSSEAAWECFWTLWNEICEGHHWALAFKELGYDILFAVEGLDKLLEPNPWQSNGQSLTERDKSRSDRIALAELVYRTDFFEKVKPATNRDHIKRREWLVARKAWRLIGNKPSPPVLAPQSSRELTAVEWLCLAGVVLTNASDEDPLAVLRGREPVQRSESALALSVVNQLMAQDAGNNLGSGTGLAIDFIVRNSRRDDRLAILSKFPRLLSSVGGDQARRLIPNLPILNHRLESIYEIDTDANNHGRYLYRCFLSSEADSSSEVISQFVHVALHEERPIVVATNPIRFKLEKTGASTINWGKSVDSRVWGDLHISDAIGSKSKTHTAAHLFQAFLAIHQLQADDERETTYVPFRPQLFREGEGDRQTIHLVADRVPRNRLGVSAWYHDRDERVQSENVPLANADIWRVGWAVADVLGVAADMAGESGERDELLDDKAEPDDEAHAKQALEDYVLRQQLRKLQGSYLSSARVEIESDTSSSLPGTVNRALKLLREFPADQGLDAQVRHVILMEAESRAMAMRMKTRSGDDLRNTLHRAFPDALARLPLWAIAGLKLQHPVAKISPLRPEPALMLALYRALYPMPAENDAGTSASALRVALALATVGVGLRGSVAALWGYAAALGSRRMAESLNLPADWEVIDMARLNPQGDYRVIRKALYDGDWPEMCKASPWQWMLALVGLLNASFSQAFNLHSLKELFKVLGAWQTMPARANDADVVEEPWPFDALPTFTLRQCESLIQALPEALCALDRERGMRVVRVHSRTFGRSRDAEEFTDASGAGWQMSKSQYTSLYANSVEEYRPVGGLRVFKVWTETRRLADNDLIALHTLDHKLGKWFPSQLNAGDTEGEEIPLPNRSAEHEGPLGQVSNAVQGFDASKTSTLYDQEVQSPDDRKYNALSDESLVKSQAIAANDLEDDTSRSSQPDVSNDSLGRADESASYTTKLPNSQLEDAESSSEMRRSERLVGKAVLDLERLNEWQNESWRMRLGGESSHDQEARISSHFRVALFQFRVDNSYSHPISEVGLGGLPLAKSSQEALRSKLNNGSRLKVVSKAAQRNSEFNWTNDESVISWPEHRRRALLSQALKACRNFKVQLLVLPEVSVRPDTVVWLKKELQQYPGLAVLAGTYRQFEVSDGRDHLKEKLTLLWQPDKSLIAPLGLEEEAEVIEFQRGKKYRSVAAHELFRPDAQVLSPLYTEEKLVEALRNIRSRAKKNDWTPDQLLPLLQAVIHGPQKLRYCMELICSELFMLTSPANRPPLQQELAKMLQLFGGTPSEAKELVDNDVIALGKILTSSQQYRERRSVLLVPACTSRSNDYWHAGQASVLASGTATVFCNAANKRLSVGGSCFIGIDSVSSVKPEHAGVVRLLTPYHGWSKGILQPDCKGALSAADQAMVIVDLDPVHVVSGKPRPQLLPEPMSLVAYLPVVEVIDKDKNADGLARALRNDLTEDGCDALREMLTNEAFPEACGLLHTQSDFTKALQELLEGKQNGELSLEAGSAKLERFKEFFGDPRAVRERIFAWLRDHHQQPAPMAGELRLEPAWLDFLVADLTWRYGGETHPEIRVTPWLDERRKS